MLRDLLFQSQYEIAFRGFFVAVLGGVNTFTADPLFYQLRLRFRVFIIGLIEAIVGSVFLL